MKSSLRTFVLAAIAAVTIAAATHSASAQAFAATATTTNKTLGANSRGTIMALILPNAGTYSLVGQQGLSVAANPAGITVALCYTTNQAGGTTPLTYGPYSMVTIPPAGGYVTVPLNGWYTTTAPTEIWVECMYWGGGAVSTELGTITGTQVH
ncbi:MAG: hypothetical protein WCC27_21955 [Acidobacteriaceae bacterium]